MPVVPASPVEATCHPAPVSAALARAASPDVVVPFRTTTVVAPWAAGAAAPGSSDADGDEDSDGSPDGWAEADAEALDEGRGDVVDPGNE